MVNKPFLLLGLAAEYRSRIQISTPSTLMCEQYCGRPSDVYNTGRPRKLTALETISRWIIYSKAKKSVFEPPFRALRGNVRTPSMARWKACGRLYIRRNWTFFRYPHTVETLWAEIVEVGVFRRGWVTLNADFRGNRGRHRPTTLGIRVTASGCPFVWYRTICSASFSFVTMHACDRQTDGWTDRITTPKNARIYSRGKKWISRLK